MSNNLKIKKISELPESKDVDTTYFFGYEPNKPIDQQSVKIPFSSIAKASKERRIAMIMESSSQVIPIGEKMKIYKATGKNISKLEIKANSSSDNNWINVPLNTNIEINISSYIDTDALIKITNATIDNTSTVYLFTKVITDK